MESKDLGSKKMNNKQSDENLTSNKDKADKSLKPEMETDETGSKKVVKRARNVNHDQESKKSSSASKISSKPSTAPEELGKKMVENQDRNSDITPNREQDLHPEDYNVD